MNKKYYLAIVTKRYTGKTLSSGQKEYKLYYQWSKGYDTLAELFTASAERAKSFDLDVHQHILIEHR